MEGKKIPATVVFNSINVNVIDSQSGIFIGENRQSNWNSSSKTNAGFGTAQGEGNIFLGLENVVIDPDTIDTPTNFINCKDE